MHTRTQSSGCKEKHPPGPALPCAMYSQWSRLPPGGRSAQAMLRGSPGDRAGQGQAQGEGLPSWAADSVPQGNRAKRSSCPRPNWGTAVPAGGDGSGGEHSGHLVTGSPVPPRPLHLGNGSSHSRSLSHTRRGVPLPSSAAGPPNGVESGGKQGPLPHLPQEWTCFPGPGLADHSLVVTLSGSDATPGTF